MRTISDNLLYRSQHKFYFCKSRDVLTCLNSLAQTNTSKVYSSDIVNQNDIRIRLTEFIKNFFPSFTFVSARQLNATTKDYGVAAFLDLQATDNFYFPAIFASASMGKREVGAGSIYFAGLRDNTSAFLDGGKIYKLTIPGPVPANLFWSATVYDVDTRSMIATDQDKAVLGSLKTKFQPNPDGSIDIYFGPNAPVGKEDQWIKTIPDKGFMVYFRIYGPEAPALDGTWKLNNIVEMK